ncbi:hypothetical protein [Pseudomonas sp. S1_E04]|jgi:hypothetical protein
MNANTHPMYMRTFHPVRVNGAAIQALGLWLKEQGSRQARQRCDLHRVMAERYPVGLFSDDEIQALCELMTK